MGFLANHSHIVINASAYKYQKETSEKNLFWANNTRQSFVSLIWRTVCQRSAEASTCCIDLVDLRPFPWMCTSCKRLGAFIDADVRTSVVKIFEQFFRIWFVLSGGRKIAFVFKCLFTWWTTSLCRNHQLRHSFTRLTNCTWHSMIPHGIEAVMCSSEWRVWGSWRWRTIFWIIRKALPVRPASSWQLARSGHLTFVHHRGIWRAGAAAPSRVKCSSIFWEAG